jgi:hypothetical protein
MDIYKHFKRESEGHCHDVLLSTRRLSRKNIKEREEDITPQNCCYTFLHGNNDFKKYLTQDVEFVSRAVTTQIYITISEEKK